MRELELLFVIVRVASFFMFSRHVDVCDSNKVEALTILEALQCFLRNILGNLIMKSDSSNAIGWTSENKVNIPLEVSIPIQ